MNSVRFARNLTRFSPTNAPQIRARTHATKGRPNVHVHAAARSSHPLNLRRLHRRRSHRRLRPRRFPRCLLRRCAFRRRLHPSRLLSPLPPPLSNQHTAGTRPAGSSRSDRIGSARIGSALLGSFDLNRHGGRHISTWLSAGIGTDRRAPLHLFFSAQLALGSAQLGSARLGSAGAAWLARLVRHSAQDSEAPASRLGGAPGRRHLHA